VEDSGVLSRAEGAKNAESFSKRRGGHAVGAVVCGVLVNEISLTAFCAIFRELLLDKIN